MWSVSIANAYQTDGGLAGRRHLPSRSLGDAGSIPDRRLPWMHGMAPLSVPGECRRFAFTIKPALSTPLVGHFKTIHLKLLCIIFVH